MSANDQMIVPFTVRSFIGVIVLLAILTSPLWWSRLRGSTTHAATEGTKPDLSGEWTGSAHITSYSEGMGRDSAMDQHGTFSVKLEMYDTFLERYHGQGTLTIGDEIPRTIQITGLSLGDWFKPEDARAAAGALRLPANLGGNLEKGSAGDDACSIQGSASLDQIQFKTVANEVGYSFDVSLHRKR